MGKRREISDDDLTLEFFDAFRATGSIRSAVVAVANLARSGERRVSRVAPAAVVETARYFATTVDDILGDGRDSSAVDPRHVAMWIAHEEGLSFPQLARVFDRNHTTVAYGCGRVSESPELLQMAREIRGRLATSSARLAAVLDRLPLVATKEDA